MEVGGPLSSGGPEGDDEEYITTHEAHEVSRVLSSLLRLESSSSFAASLRFASVAGPLGCPSTMAAGDAASLILKSFWHFFLAYGLFPPSLYLVVFPEKIHSSS